MGKNNKAGLLHQAIIHLVLIALIFGLFYAVLNSRVNSKIVKQQILEKQIALLIDSAMPGTNLVVYKENMNGFVSGIKLEGGKIFIYVDDAKFSKGYDYFTEYNVDVKNEVDKFYINIYD